MRPRAQDSLDWQDLLYLKKKINITLITSPPVPPVPLPAGHISVSGKSNVVPTLGQVLIASALRFPACRLGMPYLCENAMMSLQGITPPRLACAIVSHYLDIAAWEGIMMRLGMVKASDNVCECTQ